MHDRSVTIVYLTKEYVYRRLRVGDQKTPMSELVITTNETH